MFDIRFYKIMGGFGQGDLSRSEESAHMLPHAMTG